MRTTSLFAAALLLMGAPVVQGAVTVYGEATSTGPAIKVDLFADIPSAPLISFGLRLNYNPQSLQLQSAAKNTALWYFFDGASLVPYFEPDVSIPGTVLLIGGRLDARNPQAGVTGQRVLLGTVLFRRLSPGPLQFGLELGRLDGYANFVTPAGTILDNSADGLLLNGVSIDQSDTDLDGLPDAWETSRLGSITQYSWNDDPDGDGYNNQDEYQADTYPLKSDSCLRMISATVVRSQVRLEWQGGILATQFLQRRFSIEPSAAWQDIVTNPPPTPVIGSYLDSIGSTPAFYRIRVAR